MRSSRTDVTAIVVEFVVVFALFWTYFDDVPLARVRQGKATAELWMLAHLPLQLGIVAMAVGMSKFLQVQDHVYYESIIILSVAFALIYGGLAAIGLLGDRHPYRPLLLLAAGDGGGWRSPAGSLFWNRGWEPSPFLAILAALAVAHAVHRLPAAPGHHGRSGRAARRRPAVGFPGSSARGPHASRRLG